MQSAALIVKKSKSKRFTRRARRSRRQEKGEFLGTEIAGRFLIFFWISVFSVPSV